MKREIKTTLALDGEKAFKQGLEDASRQMRVLGSEMKANTAAFQGNANSLDALTSRGKIFEKQVAQQKEIVAALAKTVEDSAEKYGEADKRTDGYRIKLNNATAALSKMENELEQNSQAIDAFGQDAITAASEIDKLEQSAQKMSESLKGTGDKLKGIGQTMSMSVTAPIVGGMYLAIEGTKELRTELAIMETNAQQAGVSIGAVNEAYRTLNGLREDTAANSEAVNELLAAGFADGQLQAAIEGVSGAAIKFKDTLNFEGVADGLQETLATGAAVGPFGELLERSGMSLDDFNAGLASATANGTQLQYALDTMTKLGLTGVYDAFVKANPELIKSNQAAADLQMEMAELGDTLLPIITKLNELLAGFVGAFNALPGPVQTGIIAIGGLAAVLGPVLFGIGQLVSLGGSLAGAAGISGAAIAAMAGPIGVGVLAVGGLITVGTTLIKNWDVIKAGTGIVWGSIKDSVTGVANEIKTSVINDWKSLKTDTLTLWEEIKAGSRQNWEDLKNDISAKINAAKDAVGRAIDKMKGFFDFSWSLPKIKLPHFNITGGFSLNPPKVPKFNVNWYGDGGIFKEPTVIGVGEAGAEAVAPIDKLYSMIKSAISEVSASSTMNHTGTITVKGVTDRNQLMGTVDIIMDQLRREGRM